MHEESYGSSDLVAHFYRRAFNLIRTSGCFGLIATNSIAQGDSRRTGLRWICTHGGTVYSANKRYKWPGEAAVMVSVVYIRKRGLGVVRLLDEKPVEKITAFLFHAGGDEDPKPLRANLNKSFEGCKLIGMGFTFDNDNPDATSLAEMERLLEKDPRNRERIFPYMSGEELSDSPSQLYRRYAIDFFDMTEKQARVWPDLISILEAKVKRTRANLKRQALVDKWWQYGEKRPALRQATQSLARVLVISRVAKAYALAFIPATWIPADRLTVFASESFSFFSVVQSRIHEIWARFFSTTLEDRLSYTPTDCFETFPFPNDYELLESLERAGRSYYELRKALMLENDEGFTKTYNRFHDPNETSANIIQLRELHAAMDREVLDAYRWADIETKCEFLLDYEEEERGDGNRQKKPWRYRWPDQIRDEVLARLLALNALLAEEERLSGAAADGHTKDKKQGRGAKRLGTGQASFHTVKIQD